MEIERLTRESGAPPHTRGWTRQGPERLPFGLGSPAHAGMDPSSSRACTRPARLPRTRGDGPHSAALRSRHAAAPPHTRGWTAPHSPSNADRTGSPAHAGMDPAGAIACRVAVWLPRTRGDGPYAGKGYDLHPMAPPHTRGWTRAEVLQRGSEPGSPAHAGMDPHGDGADKLTGWLPRTRGDGPQLVLPDDGYMVAPPHTRGWTHPPGGHVRDRDGFPAHAGMDPTPTPRKTSRTRLPRTRGDGPASEPAAVRGTRAPPHTRGWTLRHQHLGAGRLGSPAHAGMDPRPRRAPGAGVRLPRIRGDGPGTACARSGRMRRAPPARA